MRSFSAEEIRLKKLFAWWETNGKLIFQEGDVRIYAVDSEEFLFIGPILYASTLERQWYIEHLAPYAKGQALELGLGLGCASRIIASHPRVKKLTTVEINPAIVRAYGLPHPKQKVLQVDYNLWIDIAKNEGLKYDFIFVDHYVAGDDELFEELTNLQQRLQAILAPKGNIIFWYDDNAPEEDINAITKLNIIGEKIGR